MKNFSEKSSCKNLIGKIMMYSIKMRCSKGGPHEEGGKHISGAERILREDEIEEELINVYRRAITHERGKPDFINLKIEKIDEDEIIYKKRLNINEHHVDSKEEGLDLAKELLKENDVSEESAEKAIQTLQKLKESMQCCEIEMFANRCGGPALENRSVLRAGAPAGKFQFCSIPELNVLQYIR